MSLNTCTCQCAGVDVGTIPDSTKALCLSSDPKTNACIVKFLANPACKSGDFSFAFTGLADTDPTRPTSGKKPPTGKESNISSVITEESSGSQANNTPIIAGAVVGVVVLLILIGIGIFVRRRRNGGGGLKNTFVAPGDRPSGKPFVAPIGSKPSFKVLSPSAVSSPTNAFKPLESKHTILSNNTEYRDSNDSNSTYTHQISPGRPPFPQNGAGGYDQQQQQYYQDPAKLAYADAAGQGYYDQQPYVVENGVYYSQQPVYGNQQPVYGYVDQYGNPAPMQGQYMLPTMPMPLPVIQQQQPPRGKQQPVDKLEG